MKKPTYTENGMKICQNSRVLVSSRTAAPSGVCCFAEDALAGVGGEAGRKKDGSAATVDCLVFYLCERKVEKGPMGGLRYFGGMGFTYDDRDVQDHIWNIGGFRRPLRVD